MGTKRPLSLCLDCRISHSLVSICLKPLFRKLANGDVLPFESTNPCQASSSLSTSPSPSVEPRSFCSFVRYCTDTESFAQVEEVARLQPHYRYSRSRSRPPCTLRGKRRSWIRAARATRHEAQRDVVTFTGGGHINFLYYSHIAIELNVTGFRCSRSTQHNTVAIVPSRQVGPTPSSAKHTRKSRVPAVQQCVSGL